MTDKLAYKMIWLEPQTHRRIKELAEQRGQSMLQYMKRVVNQQKDLIPADQPVSDDVPGM